MLITEMTMLVETIPRGNNDMSILHSQCYGHWYPGSLFRRVVISRDIDLVIPEYLGFNTKSVKHRKARVLAIRQHMYE